MFKTVLVPIDVSVSADTEALLKAAKELTAHWDCEVHATTVIPPMGMPIVGSYFDKDHEAEGRALVEVELRAAVKKAGVDATCHVLTGTVYDSVISYAESIGADAIIIGSHQPKLRDYLLGSNAARVVRHSKQSVIVIRSKD